MTDLKIRNVETGECCFNQISLTFVELPRFKLSIDQVKTATEKWYYFLNHASEFNQDDLEKMISDDPIFKRAYEELHQDHWSKEEIDMYEQEMQKNTQQDAEESSDAGESSDEEKKAELELEKEVEVKKKAKLELEKEVEVKKKAGLKKEQEMKKAESELKKQSQEMQEGGIGIEESGIEERTGVEKTRTEIEESGIKERTKVEESERLNKRKLSIAWYYVTSTIVSFQ